MISPAEARSRWIAGVERYVRLSDEEEQAFNDVHVRVRSFGPHTDIVQDGESPSSCCIILEGFCWRYKINLSGRRQIFSLHQAGDMPDLQSLHVERMDHTFGTITRSEIAMVPHADVRQLTRRHPRLADAFWRSTLRDAAIFREWMVNLGTRTAAQRAGHLFCEMWVLAQVAERAENQSFELPLTQAELGDVLGISTVHVNRSIRELREAGWVNVERNTITIANFERLASFSGFDPTYLDISMQQVIVDPNGATSLLRAVDGQSR